MPDFDYDMVVIGTGPAGDLLESVVAEVPEQLVSLAERVWILGPHEGLDGSDGSVGDQQVQPPVVVEVEPRRAESRVRQAGGPEADHRAPVVEQP